MAIALLTTAALIISLATRGTAAIGLGWIVLGLLIGGTIGTVMAKRVEMTKMPELIAFMHSMIGLAAVAIAIAVIAEPHRSEERRVGKECVRTCRYRWAPD